ncbi:hypothetical protein ADILRU_0871 [Leifsonia rubra CMS 76R]|nr:hypothetical protein ADILRU_0871 [Leifsonia rubra CMS 76R]
MRGTGRSVVRRASLQSLSLWLSLRFALGATHLRARPDLCAPAIFENSGKFEPAAISSLKTRAFSALCAVIS